MHKSIFFLFVFNIYLSTYSQLVKIGIHTDCDINNCAFIVHNGRYCLQADNATYDTIDKNSLINVEIDSNFLILKFKNNIIGDFSNFILKSLDSTSCIKLSCKNIQNSEGLFFGSFLIKCDSGKINIINEIDVEKYIECVVEAEAGYKKPVEFYKAQAIIARTYLTANLQRHLFEGYNLCNKTHCQVYRGCSGRYNNIILAVKETKGMIIVDENDNPINAVYHSNCGGITADAINVWQKSEPYLKPIYDPFCKDMPNSRWSNKIHIKQWENFLKKNNYKNNKNKKLNFEQAERIKVLEYNGKTIPLRSIREAFNLKSTFFSIEQHGNFLYFKGRGFGHGAGMCQEGAMEMARMGYTYVDILHFYFYNVEIKKIENFQALLDKSL